MNIVVPAASDEQVRVGRVTATGKHAIVMSVHTVKITTINTHTHVANSYRITDLHSSTMFSEESCSVGLSEKMGFQLRSGLSATVVR